MIDEKILIITSNDQYGDVIFQKYRHRDEVLVIFHDISSLARIRRLLSGEKITIRFLLKTFWCRLRFMKIFRKSLTFSDITQIESFLESYCISNVIMFRCGIILPTRFIDKYRSINIHAANLPEFSGLGSILRALDAGAYNQCVTVHYASSSIDAGKIIFQVPYKLDPRLSYCANEDQAYRTGLRALDLTIQSLI